MGLRNNQIVVASTVKAIKKAFMNGRLNNDTLYKINFFNMLDYYIDFTQCTIDDGFEGYKVTHRELEEGARRFIYCNNDEICNYKLSAKQSTAIDFLASNNQITIDTISIQISQLQI